MSFFHASLKRTYSHFQIWLLKLQRSVKCFWSLKYIADNRPMSLHTLNLTRQWCFICTWTYVEWLFHVMIWAYVLCPDRCNVWHHLPGCMPCTHVSSAVGSQSLLGDIHAGQHTTCSHWQDLWPQTIFIVALKFLSLFLPFWSFDVWSYLYTANYELSHNVAMSK